MDSIAEKEAEKLQRKIFTRPIIINDSWHGSKHCLNLGIYKHQMCVPFQVDFVLLARLLFFMIPFILIASISRK